MMIFAIINGSITEFPSKKKANNQVAIYNLYSIY